MYLLNHSANNEKTIHFAKRKFIRAGVSEDLFQDEWVQGSNNSPADRSQLHLSQPQPREIREISSETEEVGDV